ncbi:hypothetical protein [Mycobacteroides abscessus]|uniref:hypothetical protein n=1 Tax=Mycobacteroides abscessus TaxID=36809 RepID=UPI0012FFD302|nr:hypothetical protein [Mycobacteroides abscessus]
MDGEIRFDEDRIRRYIAVADNDDEARQSLRNVTKFGLLALGMLAVSIPALSVIALGMAHDLQFSNGARILAKFVGHFVTPDQAKDAIIPLLATVASINIALSVDSSGRIRRELVNISRWRSHLNLILEFSAFACAAIGIGQWFGIAEDKQRGEALVLSILSIVTVWLAHVTINRVDAVGLAESLRKEDRRLKQVAAWRVWLTVRHVPPPDGDPFPGSRWLSRLYGLVRVFVLPVFAGTIATVVLFAAMWGLHFADQVRVTWQWVAEQFPYFFTISILIAAIMEIYHAIGWSPYVLAGSRMKRWIPTLVYLVLAATYFAILSPEVFRESGITQVSYALYSGVPFFIAPTIVLAVLWLSRVAPGCRRGPAKIASPAWLAQPYWNVVWGALQWFENEHTDRFTTFYERLTELDEATSGS